MRLVSHVSRLLYEVVCYGVRQRRLTVVLVVLVGAVVLAIGVASQTAAPVVLYPFA